MIAKKNPKYDLERRRKLYLNLGFLIAGSLTLAAFKYGTPIPESKEVPQDMRKYLTEIYDVVQKPEPQQQTVLVRPEPPQIIDPERVVEAEIEPETNLISSELPEFIDFTDGQTGLGEFGLGEEQVFIDTFDSELVEQFPLYPGGDPAMMGFIQSKFKFPRDIFTLDQGTIYVRFVVSHQGLVQNAEILRGLSPELDKEALRVVSSMPNWEPGKHRGRPVNVRMIIPIRVHYK